MAMTFTSHLNLQINLCSGVNVTVSIGTLANANYFSHCLNQLTGSSPQKLGKSSLGRAMERLKLFGLLDLGGSGVWKVDVVNAVWCVWFGCELGDGGFVCVLGSVWTWVYTTPCVGLVWV
jgi:hypothetical protein